MYNPVILELVNRDQLRRMQAELSAYQAISQTEREARLESQSDHTRSRCDTAHTTFLRLIR